MTMVNEDMPVPAPTHARRRVVILEDDDAVRRSLLLLLSGHGFEVKAYRSSQALLADPEIGEARCLVADYRLAESDGIAVLERLRARGWTAPAILVTAFGSAALKKQAETAGFTAILEKPLKDHSLVTVLDRLLAPGASPAHSPIER